MLRVSSVQLLSMEPALHKQQMLDRLLV
jgi:hypothetical protein